MRPVWIPSLRRRLGCLALAGLGGALGAGPAATLAAPAPDRGQLLYATHCIACHTEQVHWRDKKVASDWSRLKAEVRRWQAAARLGWPEADIVAVARHLNETIYHLPQAADVVGRAAPGAAAAPTARATP